MALPPLTPPPAPKPVFTLVAIGQTGDTRTAIVSAFDQVLLVKVGDQIMSRFRIAAIGADAVELIDTVDNTPIRLAASLAPALSGHFSVLSCSPYENRSALASRTAGIARTSIQHFF